jgi:transcriptional regulator with XRE-family HTH domain
VRNLGPHARHPSRLGKRVTQEELAEAVGVTRGWYALLECGSSTGASTGLLDRLAEALMVTPTERAMLFQLAVPEFGRVQLHSSALYEALSDVRQTVKRLWSATSEAEIFELAGEEARRLLPHSEIIWVQRGSQVAREFPCPGRNSAARLAEARTHTGRQFTPEQRALLDALWRRTPAGDILLPLEAYPRDIVRLIELGLCQHGVPGKSLSLVAAHIRGSSGFGVSLVSSSTRPHDMSKLECALLSAIADFASLVLR